MESDGIWHPLCLESCVSPAHVTESIRSPSDPRCIAARIRGLIAGQEAGVIEATARRLGVGELALRMSIDELAPVPAFEVITAIVREYGVDPTWLVTGEYDAQTHRIALDTEPARHLSVVRAVVAAHVKPSEGSTTIQPDLRLER